MKVKTLVVSIISLILIGAFSFQAQAGEYEGLYQEYSAEGFTDDELVELFKELFLEPTPKLHFQSYMAAVKSPYAPEGSHTGAAFFKALSWYNDTTKGNRDGRFDLTELAQTIDSEMKTYIGLLQKGNDIEARLRSWKMIQKLTLLNREIVKNGEGFYAYEPKAMFEIDHNNPWNAANTIDSKEEFNRDVIEASFTKPVMVKFGLTYCVHCLLLENLGSVPAVGKKYQDVMNTKKLWWNPKSEDYKELNDIATEQGVTSSPYFILYVNGEQVNSGYAFPDENGNGVEEFLAPIL